MVIVIEYYALKIPGLGPGLRGAELGGVQYVLFVNRRVFEILKGVFDLSIIDYLLEKQVVIPFVKGREDDFAFRIFVDEFLFFFRQPFGDQFLSSGSFPGVTSQTIMIMNMMISPMGIYQDFFFALAMVGMGLED